MRVKFKLGDFVFDSNDGTTTGEVVEILSDQYVVVSWGSTESPENVDDLETVEGY